MTNDRRKTIYKLTSMKGLGDNIYQRAFIKNLPTEALVVLDTPWPEIYQDLPNVYFEHCKTELRTQKKNTKKTDYCGRRAIDIGIAMRDKSRIVNLGHSRYTNTGILKGMESVFKIKPSTMDLPTFNPSKLIADLIGKRYALIRPVTVRTEWHSDARNSLPEYLAQAVELIKAAGFITVSVADVDGINEKFVGEFPKCDFYFNKGELLIKDLLCLTENASLVVGGIGWAVPASLAYRVNSIFICGGWGEFNHPNRLLPDYEVPQVRFLMPDHYCMCRDSNHKCNKTISKFNEQFSRVLNELTIKSAA